jgi:hypothetical protein
MGGVNREAVTIGEAARFLGISNSSLAKIAGKKIDFRRDRDGKKLFRLADLEKLNRELTGFIISD